MAQEGGGSIAELLLPVLLNVVGVVALGYLVGIFASIDKSAVLKALSWISGYIALPCVIFIGMLPGSSWML